MTALDLLRSQIEHYEQLLHAECEQTAPSNLVRAYYRGALDGLRAVEEELRKEVNT